MAYAFIMRPVQLGLSRMKSLEKALQAATDVDVIPDDSGLNAYLRQIKLDTSSTVYLPDRPEDFSADTFYSYFEYSLP